MPKNNNESYFENQTIKCENIFNEHNISNDLCIETKTNDIDSKNVDTARESLRLFNIALSRAVKRGVIKKKNASRKLSSLSNKLKKTT